MKRYLDFINESNSHSLEKAFNDTSFNFGEHQKNSAYTREFLDSFQNFVSKSSLDPIDWVGSFNVISRYPSMLFDFDRKRPELMTNKIDTISGIKFLLVVDEDFFGEDSSKDVYELAKTVEIYQPEPAEDVVKFSNTWGFSPVYTLVKFHSAQSGDDWSFQAFITLLITFVYDEEIAHKYRGTITGRKYGL